MSALPEITRVEATAESLTIGWHDGRQSRLASDWLNDNRPEHRDPHSGQRLVDVADLPDGPRLRAARIDAGNLVVDWEGGGPPSVYPPAWLHALDPEALRRRPERRPRRWLEGAAMDGRRAFAWAAADALGADPALRRDWVTRLIEDGIAFLHGVPCTEHAILAALQPVGVVADTNYGRVFDVRSVARPENLAYSDFGLGLHTDNPYRDPVPGFQALHVLSASPDGGESLFADGFALAEHLREHAPVDFARLTSTPVPFRYRSADADLYSEKPLIECDLDGAVRAVHYNSRSIAPLALPVEATADFYAAYRRFARLLREPRFQVRMKLADGELVVFDNRRTLHGRSAFSSARHPRHLQGCYLTRDSVLSTAALLGRSGP